MKRTYLNTLGAITLAPLLLLTSCQTGATWTATTIIATEPGVGTVELQTYTTSATVVAIDGANRTVRLKDSTGHEFNYKVSTAAVNFNQLQIGDRVGASVMEALAVYIGPKGSKPTAGKDEVIALAPKGAKPGGVVVTTDEIVARIVSVDTAGQHVTLRLADGSKVTVKVGKRVNLAEVKVGSDVTVSVTQGFALVVQKAV